MGSSSRDLGSIVLNEINQSEKDKYHIISYVESNEQKLMNEVDPETWKHGLSEGRDRKSVV